MIRCNNQNKQKGQGMTEYIIIVALIAIAGIAIMQTFGQTIRAQFGKITSSLQGKDYSGTDVRRVTRHDTGDKDLSDFDDRR